ncbi:PREDICTED: carboxypeptidase D isoform X1 [Rhagoletis zephyria]|uniref:carboxypeptidase D isoform X1 n=1 Tax=Rhagoletis zephyria TaxID=28612 RepID=UPI000811A70E|nr:PREDICTED: carboxypeptidase D isoform X1 [Rhagoletis zephyria]XP_017489637.1 PREDICTED: carboxypeptidase D isoform X1 [Rhagoletis zephyria]XP_017489708.1 PREDICTED: carboxypeptidase D isoform X1 [Rhagoletis zephyria]XP_017489776.1 PREDICTED: carboxypeptidase D isoform X1 [Rhagoletis zephyria]
MCMKTLMPAHGIYAFLVGFAITCASIQLSHSADANTTSAGLSAAANAPASPVEDETFIHHPPPHFLSNGEISALFGKLQDLYPQLATKYSIGKTVKGREMYALALTARYNDDKNGDLLRPMVKLTANIHGDEALGRQMVLFLAEYLTLNYVNVPEVQRLLNNTEIHILPSCNPDGFAEAKEGNCESLPNYVGRTNAAGVDLNRDFPDRLENQQTIQLRSHTRQPETAAIINWVLSKPFVLSANFHGGAIVASYPYDNSIAHRECCEESLTPDDRIFKLMAHTYANNHPIMRKGHNCNDTFTDGITNGANWYELNGGMQDFNYAFTNCFELTIELSCCKFPTAASLPTEWARNKRSLLQLLQLAHIGIKGLITDASGYPINDASIVVSGLEDKPMRTTQRGEYWRLLTPGIYNVQALAFGYQPSEPKQVHVTNENSEALRLDFTLSPLETNYDGNFRKVKVERSKASTNDDDFLTPTKFEHHNFTAMEKFIRNIAESYPSITRLYSIGQSVQHRDLWVMEIFATPGQHIPGVPEFKYVANMHGNEVVGKEMLLLLTKYMCERYGVDERITKLVNTTRMHFLYSMNPDGYEISHEGDKTSGNGRENANHIDLNRNFPDQYGTDKYNAVTEPEVAAVMNWTLSIPFVLSANLHGGSLVANYPYDDNENDFSDPIARLRIATNVGRKINPTEENDLFKHLALVYSEAHPSMHLGNPCPSFKHEIFPQGIVNGAQWYSVTGGMQDWNYVRAGVLELTLELGCDKFPMTDELPKYWHDNREPLLKFIEQVHYGVHGTVRSSIGTAIAGAVVMLDGAKHASFSGVYGDYWKLALPGRHNITIIADGFAPYREEIEIPEDTHEMRLDVILMRDDPQHWSSANDFRIIENVVKTRYHSNPEIRQRLAEFETRHGQIATFGYAESEFGIYYNSIKLTSDIGEPEESKYKILILSSFFDTTSPLGREITMNVARHVLEGYKIRDTGTLNMLQRSVLYLLPLTDNFEVIFKMYNRNNSICDPELGNELADRMLSPESEKKRDLLLQFLESERFDLMLTFTAGSSELIYPKGEPVIEKFAHIIKDSEFNAPPLQCPTTSTRSLHHAATERLTNLLYKMYNIPLFSLGLSCCRMPVQSNIASVWRTNINKIKNFLRLIETGIVGVVHNDKSEPLREAFIRLIDHKHVYNVTRNAARFQIILPAGEYALEISASGYESTVKRVTVTPHQINNLGVVQLNAYALLTGVSEIHRLGGGDSGYIDNTGSATSLTAQTATISGFVLDIGNHPVKHAKVSVIAPHTREYLRNFTDSLGAYSIRGVPLGEITLKVEAPRHEGTQRAVHVESGAVRGVIFRLKVDEHVWGMPRLLFILFASIVIIVAMILFFLCVQFLLARRHRADKRYYSFSLLPQKGKELFEDDGEDGETELFRSPIKNGMSIQPYFDEHIEHGRSDDDDDDDFDNDFNEDSGEDIVMLDKRNQL